MGGIRGKGNQRNWGIKDWAFEDKLKMNTMLFKNNITIAFVRIYVVVVNVIYVLVEICYFRFLHLNALNPSISICLINWLPFLLRRINKKSIYRQNKLTIDNRFTKKIIQKKVNV